MAGLLTIWLSLAGNLRIFDKQQNLAGFAF
jgi:hypothetical protein